MKPKVKAKLQAMRSDYKKLKGKPFDYFFCPVLLLDQNTELCEAHIVNKAFTDAARSWTIQRKDVDGFFGRYFEADFLKIEYKIWELSPEKVISNTKLVKRFRPTIQIDDKLIEYYFTTGNIPNGHSSVKINEEQNSPVLALKIHPDNIQDKVEIDVRADLRVSAVVSLIKAAFLTLFEMLGYRYSMSAAGLFVGHEILGKFYLENKNASSKENVYRNAILYFERYVHLVRPVDSTLINFNGTCKDKKLFLCFKNNIVWACIVFIKISNSLHAVLLPFYENEVGLREFELFLESPGSLLAKLAIFNGTHWALSKDNYNMYWPNNDASLLT